MSNLYKSFPNLRNEWNSDIEIMKTYSHGSHKKVSWRCKTGNSCHIWITSIKYRTRKNNPVGCPFCSGHKTCSCGSCPNLYNNFPLLRNEWNDDIEIMKTYPPSTDKKVSWKCKTGNICHIWEASIFSRTRKNNPIGCPFCVGRQTCSCESCPNLYNNFPHLRNEWNDDVEIMKTCSSGTHKKVSWKCKTCHIWEARISDRTKKNDPVGCPFCYGKKTCSCESCSNLYNNFPHLRNEWNDDLEIMKTYPPSSNKKVSWKCKTGNTCHIWEAIINDRTRKNYPSGCPFCTNKTEAKLYDFLQTKFNLVEKEKMFEWLGRRRFDFLIDNKIY